MMRTWMLGVALAGATGGGVAFVLAGKTEGTHCGPCVAVVPANPSECPETGCSKCKATPASDVIDVTDVSSVFAAADNSRPFVSFEEPPFAKPVVRLAETEAAPMPRAVAEVCPMPRLVGEEAPMPRAAR